MRTFLCFVILAVLAGRDACANASEQVLHDERLGFSLTIPEPFEEDPTFLQLAPNLIYSYFAQPTGRGMGTLILIEQLDGPIGRQRPERPPDFKGTLFKLPWHKLNIYATEDSGNLKGVTVDVLRAYVPLKPVGIALIVMGSPAERNQLQIKLRGLLASLDGPSSWDDAGRVPTSAPAQQPAAAQPPAKPLTRNERLVKLIDQSRKAGIPSPFSVIGIASMFVGALIGAVMLRIAVATYNLLSGRARLGGDVLALPFSHAASIAFLLFLMNRVGLWIFIKVAVDAIAIMSPLKFLVLFQAISMVASLSVMTTLLSIVLSINLGRAFLVTLCYMLVPIVVGVGFIGIVLLIAHLAGRI